MENLRKVKNFFVAGLIFFGPAILLIWYGLHKGAKSLIYLGFICFFCALIPVLFIPFSKRWPIQVRTLGKIVRVISIAFGFCLYFWFAFTNPEVGSYLLVFAGGVFIGKVWGNATWMKRVPRESFVGMGGEYYIFHKVAKEDIPPPDGTKGI